MKYSMQNATGWPSNLPVRSVALPFSKVVFLYKVVRFKVCQQKVLLYHTTLIGIMAHLLTVLKMK